MAGMSTRCKRPSVDKAHTFGICAQPQSALQVLTDGKDGAALHVVATHLLSVGAELVESVLVSAHPEVVLLVQEEAVHAVVAYDVAIAQAESHVAEVVATLWCMNTPFCNMLNQMLPCASSITFCTLLLCRLICALKNG